MSYFEFVVVILFGLNFLSQPCQGQVSLPPEGDTFVVEPGQDVKIKWSYRNAGIVFFRSWKFESSDGGRPLSLANISSNGNPVTIKNVSFPGVEIEKPATLILRNVSLRHNGTYILSVASFSNAGSSKVALFVAGPLNMLVCSSPITANESTNVACMCKAERDNTPEPPSVTWCDKDGKQIGGVGRGMKELNLNNVARNEAETFTCKADSYGLKQNKSIQVTVNFAPVNTQFTVVNKTGGKVTLKCEAEGLPEPTYEIKFNGTIINSNKSDTIEVGDSNLELYNCTSTNMLGSETVNLTLPATTPSPSPTGTTRSHTNMGPSNGIATTPSPSPTGTTRSRTNTGPSNGIVKPAVTVCPSPITVNEGDNVTCLCKVVRGYSPVSVTWYKDGVQIGSTRDNETWLTLRNVNKTFSGTFKCVAQNLAGMVETPIEVIVNYAPEEPDFKNVKVPAVGAKSFTFECEANAVPPPSYTIIFNDTVTVSTTNTYTINAVNYTHAAGSYKCIARNKFGKSSKTSFLFVVLVETATSDESNGGTAWYIFFGMLVLGIIIGVLLSCMLVYCRRRFKSKKSPQKSGNPQAQHNTSIYQDLDLRDMKSEDNYQSLRGDYTRNDPTPQHDPTYTELSKRRDDEDNYQTLS